jgi:nicotinamide mononucleotide adenylyltransferase
MIKMVEETVGNCMVIVGSANAPQSMRQFFTYSQRRAFIKHRYAIRVAPLPDFEENDDWFQALTDIIALTGNKIEETTFYAGCEEDVSILSSYTSNFVIVNRFEDTKLKISATEVRDALIMSKSLDGLLHPAVIDKVKNQFRINWQQFKLK